MDNKDKRTKTMGREEGQEWTQRELIEQSAADILGSCAVIEHKARGCCYDLLPDERAVPHSHVLSAVRSIKFIAEGIFKALEGEDE